MIKSLLASAFLAIGISILPAVLDACPIDPEQDPKPHSVAPSLMNDLTTELLSVILSFTGEHIEKFKEFGKVSKIFNASMKYALTTYPDTIYIKSPALTLDNVETLKRVPKLALAVLNPDENTIMLIGKLINIKYLDLSNTRLADKDCIHLSGLINLTMLSLNGTSVGPGLTFLKNLGALQHLDLDYTFITDAELACLTTLARLSHLYLEGTPITNDGFLFLGGLTNLRYLNVDETEITGSGMIHIKKLTNLTGLSFRNTHFNDVGLAHITSLTKLERLILESTKVTNKGLPYLRPLEQLKLTNLINTGVTEGGRTELSDFQKIRE